MKGGGGARRRGAGTSGGSHAERRAPEGQRGDEVLDVLGLYCPIPIIRTAERIRMMEAGRILEVVSDDRVVLLDMPAWCRSHGQEYLGFREEAGAWRLFVRKAPGGADPPRSQIPDAELD